MSEDINQNRRRFVAIGIATAGLGAIGIAHAQADRRATRRAANASVGTLKQIDAGLLSIGYAEAGPADGPPVIILHGWPYDIYSYVEVAPLLAAAGYGVIVPFVRGCGTTRFRSDATFRNGQQTAVAVDRLP